MDDGDFAIEFRGLHKSFGDKTVLRGLDLRIRRGEVMFIIGTSGVGKSVTIKHLVGLLRPDRGECWFGGRRVDDLSESPQRTVDLKLRDPAQFKLVAMGDKVEATYTEAMAISVQPPAAKK